jgi:Leucine-rich repeat (LRR) protein
LEKRACGAADLSSGTCVALIEHGRLTRLNLRSAVSEDFARSGVPTLSIASFADFAELRSLDLHGTKTSGDIANLAGLTKLSELDLADTSVKGDIVKLASLTELKSLNLSGTKVSGDISRLVGLKKLSGLFLKGTYVKGDVGIFKRVRGWEVASCDLK